MLCLTLFDPEKCRGARHNNPDQSLSITEYTATPGYTLGKLQAGTWTVFIDTHRILPPEPIQYTLEIEMSDELIEKVALPAKGITKPRGPGWYRGDLHGHTLHSDARWNVPDFAKYARDYKLDFVTLTDHNTVSALAQLDSLAGDDLLTMGGNELTTYYGHALALGVREWQEWRVGTGITMMQIAKQVKTKNGIFIIAHPHSVGDPECTGCDWSYKDMMPGIARHIEIWNGSWAGDSGNERGLRRFYQWLNEGYRMVATAGTDIHGPMEDPQPGFNQVYADELNEGEILKAIQQGHLYLSSGPRLEFTANNQDEQVMIGDIISGTITLFISWSECSDDDGVRLIADGNIIKEIQANGQGKLEYLHQKATWYAVEIRSKDGLMKAITNPIFMGQDNQWY
jgi:hypothetical protein